MERRDLYTAIIGDIEHRTDWETRQGLLYKGRYRGLRRTNQPFPHCSDINWPLVDGIIDKLKPIYFGQLFATDLLATFLPTAEASGMAAQLATASAQWFDYRLKQDSNLEQELLHVIDSMLMLGRPAVKTVWDVDAERICFTTVPPTRLVVPSSTRELCYADRIVHILSYTPEAYARVPGYRQGADWIKRVTGRGPDRNSLGEQSIRTESLQRMGITQGQEDEIIVWEAWVQQDDKKWTYETFCPVDPEADVKARIENPNEHGEPPFTDFAYEVTQPDWLAPRGVTEILLPFQAELTKLLNEKNDAMTFFNRPLFRAERDVPNAANLRLHPGQILPYGIMPVTMPPPPVDWERQMVLMRDIAERQISVPDYGMSQVGNVQDARTATEIEQISSVSQQSADLRMRIFRMSLGRLYQQAWAILRQYSSTKLKVWINDALTDIPEQALTGRYRIKPSGSADGVTRQQAWRKAVARLQMFAQDPFINQGELRKSVLEADDSGIVKRLYADPQVQAANQAEDQMMEVAIMKLGHSAQVTAADDHAAHLRTILHYIQTQAKSGQPPAGFEMQMLQEHTMIHMQALQEKDPKMAKQAADAFTVVFQQLAGAGQKNGGPPQPGQPTPSPGSPAAARGMVPAPAGGGGGPYG